MVNKEGEKNEPLKEHKFEVGEQDALSGPGWYYFYQAADGQHFYLHPLDIKVLKHEFGSYDNFPAKLKLPIIAVYESTVNNDLRKRCKYLAHLPLACDITFCEVDLSDVVSSPTYLHFEKEILDRFEKLRLKEKAAKKEKKTVEMTLPPMVRSPILDRQSPDFFTLENFGPPLSSSPEYTSAPNSMASTPPGRSFALAAREHASPKVVKSEPSSWTFTIPDEVMNASLSTPANRKNKGKKGIMLFGNGGSRSRG